MRGEYERREEEGGMYTVVDKLHSFEDFIALSTAEQITIAQVSPLFVCEVVWYLQGCRAYQEQELKRIHNDGQAVSC